MTNLRQEFKNWLEANTNRKENLPNWEEFLNIVSDVDANNFIPVDYHLIEAVNFVWNSNDTPDNNIERYFNIYYNWKLTVLIIFVEIPISSFVSPGGLLAKKAEFTQLKSEKDNLATQLQTQTTTLTNLRQQVGTNLEKVLELYCETYISMVKQKNENNNFAQNQMLIFEKTLQEKLSKEELKNLLNKQKEVLELEEQLKIFVLQEEEYKTSIQIVEK